MADAHAESLAGSDGSIVDLDGLRGRIVRSTRQRGAEGALLLVEMMDGRRLWAPEDWLEARADGEYYLPFRTAHLPEAVAEEGGRLVIPVLVETLDVRKRKRVTGSVRITKRVTTEDQVVEPMRAEETVEVERVPIDREVAEPPPVRQEGDTMIVPILEEVLVVEKRLILREEVRITKRRREITERYRVTLRREEAEIERLPGEDEAAGALE
jgi:uncharacterized protein (TIGR02271 family)